MRDASGTWQAAQQGAPMRQSEAGVYESLKMKVVPKFLRRMEDNNNGREEEKFHLQESIHVGLSIPAGLPGKGTSRLMRYVPGEG